MPPLEGSGPTTDQRLDPRTILQAFRSTVVREHMSLRDARDHQFRLVDAIQRVMGSDAIFTDDHGQARHLATVDFGGGGRPESTARAEEALASFFQAESAVLVHGAGTGAIRAMLNAALEPADTVVIHDAPPYKTTAPSMKHMGLRVVPVDLNSRESLDEALGTGDVQALYLQHVPQRLGDNYDLAETMQHVRTHYPQVQILVDENYAVMRARRIGVQLGSHLSSFSLFKLLAPSTAGCVLGSLEAVVAIRRDLSSAGCQVQGHDAMEALRSLVHAPVALALQNEVVIETTDEINRLISEGKLPFLHGAVAAQPGIRCTVLVFDLPVAEEFLRSAWRNGSPSRSVGEEARPEMVPLFTYLTRTFLRGTPKLERYAVRVNPLRGGSETILRVLRLALEDEEFQKAARDIGQCASD